LVVDRHDYEKGWRCCVVGSHKVRIIRIDGYFYGSQDILDESLLEIFHINTEVGFGLRYIGEKSLPVRVAVFKNVWNNKPFVG
jgi:hypothetical protein